MAAKTPGLVVHNVGTGFRHGPEFRIHRPRGSGDYLFAHFTTPIRIRDRQGERTMPAETCVLYAPGFPQWYDGPERGFANDWCHFGGRAVSRWVRRCRVPVNRAVTPLQLRPLASLVQALEREFLRREPFWRETSALLLAQLLVAFARGATTESKTGATPRQADLARRLRDLRLRVHQRLGDPWTVPRMAAEVHLSPSRFAHVYRQFFGTGPKEDLIDARVSHACWLLSSGTVAVKQAAAESGFADIHYFSRCFRARVGCAPRNYVK
jgi:AraC-like DNA-binding protein